MTRSSRLVLAYAAVTAASALALLAGCETAKPAEPREVARGDERYFPTGDRATSSVLLRQFSPREIRVGQEYDSTIEVVNLTNGALRNVSVNLESLANTQYISATPAATRSDAGDLTWLVAEIPAAGTRQIKLRAKAVAPGVASSCLTVGFANMLCASSTVVQPSLVLEKRATPETCGTCEEIKFTYLVKNAGTGTAEGVVLKDALPAGLTTADGKSTVEISAGDLAEGAEKSFNIAVQASKRGRFSSSATATSTAGLSTRSSDPATVVKQPVFAFSCDANNRVFLGRDLDYRITVRNIGDCPANGATIKALVPAGASYLSADNSGRLEGGYAVWNMTSLPAGQATTVTMRIRPSSVGFARVEATASAACAAPVTTNCATEVVGIPAILLEVVDALDPIAVGNETTFIVTATNQGSSDDTNVKVVATLPASMEFVSGSGATPVTLSGQTVTMSPIARLAPGAKAEWRVVVKAKSAADARSRWEMTSDQFKLPIIETESSNLYTP
ncbi:MAG: hypothetical protein NTU45_11865 [Planctomycetota bacterium]|jgi:uncharacterized repeat protein (TIGR01451 family)|nr:hypothetical protein [Planctomycetota bacterium]